VRRIAASNSKRSQLFIRVHNETLSVVAVCASAIQIVRPLESTAATQPQLQRTPNNWIKRDALLSDAAYRLRHRLACCGRARKRELLVAFEAP
jgi:cation diffusion facilitator CzcD-associated flavoprotein CzcO